MKEELVSESIFRVLIGTRIMLCVCFLFVQFFPWASPRERSYIGMVGIVTIIALGNFFRRLSFYAWHFDAAFLERCEFENEYAEKIRQIDQLLRYSDKHLRRLKKTFFIFKYGGETVVFGLNQLYPAEIRKVLTQTRKEILEKRAAREWPKEPRWIAFWRRVL